MSYHKSRNTDHDAVNVRQLSNFSPLKVHMFCIAGRNESKLRSVLIDIGENIPKNPHPDCNISDVDEKGYEVHG